METLSGEPVAYQSVIFLLELDCDSGTTYIPPDENKLVYCKLPDTSGSNSSPHPGKDQIPHPLEGILHKMTLLPSHRKIMVKYLGYAVGGPVLKVQIFLYNIQEIQYKPPWNVSSIYRMLSVLYLSCVMSFCRREDERLQATGAELGDSIFNMTGENGN